MPQRLPAVRSEAAARADFSQIRYAQCWEDADVLLEGLDIQPSDSCLSIASAGDNALAMLSRAPSRLVALDLSPAQLACVELRGAAYREPCHLALADSVPGLLLPPGDGAAWQRPRLLPLCEGQRGRPYPGSHATRVDSAGSSGESVSTVDPYGATYDSFAIRPAAGEFRGDPR